MEQHEQGSAEETAVPAPDRQPERPPQPAPRVYVASLSDYNAGRLHGAWIAADQEEADIQSAVQEMLAASPTPGAEEWAIHDYEGFGPVHLTEFTALSTISLLGPAIAEHGSAFAHWAALIGTADERRLEAFPEAYLGQWESITEYADELLTDLGLHAAIEECIPEALQPYVTVDVEGYARDLELDGVIMTSQGDEGVYIFSTAF